MEKSIEPLFGMKLVFTDEPEKARDLADSGLCFITIAGMCDGAAAYVEKTEDFDQLNDSFLERVCCRFYGKRYILMEREGMVLRECDRNDYAFVLSLLEKNRDAVRDFEDGLWLEDVTASEQFEKTTKDYYSLLDFGLWILELEGKRAGMFGLSAEEEGTEMYYILEEEYRRRGIAGRVGAFICDYARDELALDKLWIRCLENNKPSRRLAEELGFKLYSSENQGTISELKFIKEF